MPRGVLGRLASMPALGSPAQVSRAQSVLAHLRSLLNTRAGGSQTCPEYGIPDLTDFVHSFPGGARELRVALQRVVTEHEPRLTDVQVHLIEGAEHDLMLHFEITACLHGPSRQVLRFDTRVLRGGRVVIG